MAVDSFIDLLDDSGQLWVSAWRCLNCGKAMDPVTVKNVRRTCTTVVTGSARLRDAVVLSLLSG
jgi:hypothetical protein